MVSSLPKAGLPVVLFGALLACTNQLPTFVEEDRVLSIELSENCAIVNVGRTCTIEGRALTEGGERVPGATLQWESRQPNIAAVEANRDRGVVTGRNDGFATIVASVPDDPGIQDRVTVRVLDDPGEEPLAELVSLEFQVVAGLTVDALAGAVVVQGNVEGGIEVEAIVVEADVRPPGAAAFRSVDVAGCRTRPALPFRVDFRETIEFEACDLSEAIASGATFRVTALVETDVLERALEIEEESIVP